MTGELHNVLEMYLIFILYKSKPYIWCIWIGIDCKEVQPLFFWGTNPMTQFAPMLNSLFPLHTFLFHSLSSCYRQLPQPYSTSSCPKMSYQYSLHIINGFKQISKWWFCHFNFCFLPKIKNDKPWKIVKVLVRSPLQEDLPLHHTSTSTSELWWLI